MKKLVAIGTGVVALAPALASASNWYDITLSTSPVTTAAGVVITALASVWAIRKVIKLVNRS